MGESHGLPLGLTFMGRGLRRGGADLVRLRVRAGHEGAQGACLQGDGRRPSERARGGVPQANAARSTSRLFGTAVSAGSLPSISSDTQPLKPAFAQDPRDARVVEIERVPLAAAVVGLGLHDGGVRREPLDARVRVAGEVAGVEVDAEPGRADGLVDAQQVLDASW